MGRNSITGTCKDCKERHEACHDHCEKYLQARDEWNSYKEMISQAKAPSEHDLYKMSISVRKRKWREWHDK